MEYTATETPMTSYLNAHLALQQLRETARVNGDQGPRVRVITSAKRRLEIFTILRRY